MLHYLVSQDVFLSYQKVYKLYLMRLHQDYLKELGGF